MRRGWVDADERWPQRAQIAARMIPAGASVLDVGAGSQGLASYLPASCRYTPADVVRRTPATLLLDLRRGPIPDRTWDVVVALGVLEYVDDVLAALRLLRRLGRTGIVSYAIYPRDRRQRRLNGWRSHASARTLGDYLPAAGWETLGVSRWAGQRIYLLR